MQMGLGFILILVIVIGISMSAGDNGLGEVLPAFLNFFDDYLIPFLLGIAFLIFIWNAVRFFVIGGATDEGRENAKSLALYSIAAFVFILSFWGLINLFADSLGLDNCGNGVVPDYLGDDAGSSAPCTSPRPRSRPTDSAPLPPITDPISV